VAARSSVDLAYWRRATATAWAKASSARDESGAGPCSSGGSVNASPAIVGGRLFWGSGFSNYGLGDPNGKLFSFSQ
jgi:hypothetical protein